MTVKFLTLCVILSKKARPAVPHLPVPGPYNGVVFQASTSDPVSHDEGTQSQGS